MATVDEALEDEGYVRWVQIGTCLGFVKKGLEEFVLQQSQVLQQRVKTNAAPSANALCYDAKIEKQKVHGKWTMTCNISRNCQDCQGFLDELVNVCKPPFKFYYKHFENSNIHLWPVDNMHWNMAKVYMSPDLDPTQQSQNPQDTDLSNILNFIEHCSVPALAINDQNNLNGVRTCRNEVMHTSSFTVSEPDFKRYVNSMDLLLNDQTRVAYMKDAQDGAAKIKEIRDSQTFTITTDAEFRVLRDRALALQKQNSTMMAEVEDLEKECEVLAQNGDDNSKTRLTELVQEIEEYQESLKELESTFKKYNAITTTRGLKTTNRGLKTKLQPYIQSTHTSLNLSKQQMTDIRNKYKRDSTEKEEDALEKATEQYETDEEKYDAMKEIARSLMKENADLKAEVHTLKETAETASDNIIKCKDKINELENELQEFRSKHERIKDDIEKKEREIEDMKKLNVDQQCKIKHNEEKLAKQELEIQQLEEKLNIEAREKEKEIQILKAEIESLSNAIGEKDDTIGKLETDIGNLTLELSISQKEIEKKDLDLQMLKADIQELQSSYEFLNDQIKQKDKEIEAVREKDDIIGKLNTEIGKLTLELSIIQQEVEKKDGDLRKCETEIQTLATKVVEKDISITELETKNKTLTTHLTIMKAELKYLSESDAKYEAHINELKQNLKTEQHEIIEIIDAFRLVEHDYVEAYTDVKCLNKEINALIDMTRRHDVTIADLKSVNREMKDKIQNLEIKNEGNTRKLQSACDRNETLRNKIRALTNDTKKQTKEVLRLTIVNQELHAENTRLQQNNNDLEETKIRLIDEITELLTEKEKSEADIIGLNNVIRKNKELMTLFKKDIDAVAELRHDNDRLRRTDTTLFRICCCAIILFAAVFSLLKMG